MTRYALLVVGLALAGATGCAQCDTCDDFPAPCTGPNCGQNGYATGGFIPPTQYGLPENPAVAPAPPTGSPDPTANGPAADAPSLPSPTMPPATNPSGDSPPLPNTP